jgi:hypothetical protein
MGIYKHTVVDLGASAQKLLVIKLHSLVSS